MSTEKNDFRLLVMGSGAYFESYIGDLSSNQKSNVCFASNDKALNCSLKPKLYLRNGLESETDFQSRLLEIIDKERITHLLSIQYPRKISREIIDSVNSQAFNLHLAPLPEFKGWNGSAHAILEGFPYYGPTLHWMTQGIDDGDICFSSYAPIQAADSSYTILKNSRERGRELVIQLLEYLLKRLKIPRHPQLTEGTFYSKHDIESFRVVREVDDEELILRTARAFSVPGYPPALLEIRTGEFIEIQFNSKECSLNNHLN